MQEKTTMKKTILILLAVLMTGGCSRPQPTVIEETAPPQDTTPAPSVETKTVTLESDEHIITFEIPVTCTAEEIMLEQAKEILIKDGANEIISVGTGFFGVCGTGLTEKRTTINDKAVTVGYYDGNPEWSFAVFTSETPRVYAISRIYEGDQSSADMILQSIQIR